MGWIDNDLTSLGGYSETVSGYLNVPVPCNYPVTGRDAFRTGTGIHTAAILKAIENNDEWLANRVYSPYPPQWVGRELSIEVGPMSGKSNAVYWLKKNNFPVNDDMIEKILIRAKESDRVLKDEEIMEVIKDNQ
ncbi:MAG: hypothetical protein BWK80_30095 [Desulfobacteraceae bacterium IS3]|nr:MAG: hypothetical protein BWK80_30095 [Desulfobacteraceae bacterium IS3]